MGHHALHRRKNMITIEDIKNNEEIKELILSAQRQLDALGYT